MLVLCRIRVVDCIKMADIAMLNKKELEMQRVEPLSSLSDTQAPSIFNVIVEFSSRLTL